MSHLRLPRIPRAIGFGAGLLALALLLFSAAGALWGLWRAPVRGGTWAMLGLLACGFGAWHVVDAVLSHWLLGLHRIRLDTARPLAWDLGWMVGFGLLPMALGWWLWRRPQGGPPPSGPALAMLALAVLGTGAWAARPPRWRCSSVSEP